MIDSVAAKDIFVVNLVLRHVLDSAYVGFKTRLNLRVALADPVAHLSLDRSATLAYPVRNFRCVLLDLLGAFGIC